MTLVSVTSLIFLTRDTNKLLWFCVMIYHHKTETLYRYWNNKRPLSCIFSLFISFFYFFSLMRVESRNRDKKDLMHLLNRSRSREKEKEVYKGLFTWRWGTPGRWGNPLRWGNPPLHIISHFNVITFTC